MFALFFAYDDRQKGNMELRKIGKFIAERRKAKKITQEGLAEMLDISDRAISKWERGLSFPNVDNIPRLCEILEISVSELFCGERSDMKDNKTEKALLEIARAKEETDRRLLSLEIIIGVAILILYLIIIMIAAYVAMPDWARKTIIASSTAVFVIVCFVLVKMEQIAGYYKCDKCGHKYVPSYWIVNLAPHFGRTRYMKCPKCNKRSWQRKVLK